jgi:RHS repeat-associated protein
MDDVPVATLRPNGSSITVYYVHTDHPGTPRKVTNPSGNTVVWRWDPDTFGSLAPSVTSITYNLRFPGQYYQAESGLHYNYFRDYDRQTGRYVESDLIGLFGGSYSPYGYVWSDPIGYLDPFGLWSISGNAYISGWGFELTFGRDDGRFFVTGRAGLGAGGGWAYDAHGKIPGPRPKDPCKGGAVLAATLKGDLKSGPASLGFETGAARNYSNVRIGSVFRTRWSALLAQLRN